jgi:hypothetical protein
MNSNAQISKYLYFSEQNISLFVNNYVIHEKDTELWVHMQGTAYKMLCVCFYFLVLM